MYAVIDTDAKPGWLHTFAVRVDSRKTVALDRLFHHQGVWVCRMSG